LKEVKMKKKKILGLAMILIMGLPFCLILHSPAQTQKAEKEAAPIALIKLKVFEGIREGRVEPIKTVTSSFLRYTVSASFKVEETSDKEENQLRRVFNLKGVRMLTEANLSWPGTQQRDFHMFRLDSKEYAIIITLVRVNTKDRITCRVEVLEQDKNRKNTLLDSELALDRQVITTFGFEDNSAKPYFVSLKVQEIRPGPGSIVRPVGGVEGAVGGIIGGVFPPEPPIPKDVVRATGDIKPPRLIKKVEPVYPEEAKKAGVEGLVILEVQTDKTGQVASIRVLRSVPLLNQAAIDAVKQWVYEPMIVDGQPKGVVFTVTVNFKLPDDK
jgi:TonB family protein